MSSAFSKCSIRLGRGNANRFSSESSFTFELIYQRVRMKEVRKITHKVILLLMDILVFTYQIVREVILPTRRRKGNILSSLLTFFVGLMERVVSFEKSVVRQPVIFSHKYVKQGLVIAVGFLFLLSSVEWTVGQPGGAPINETQAVVTSERAWDAIGGFTTRHVKATVQILPGDFITRDYLSYKTSYLLSPGATPFDRCLRYCVFRI